MMRFLLACAFVLGACEKKPEDSPPAKPAGEPAQPNKPEPSKGEPTPAPASPAGLVGGGRMQHCPTAVAGSTTTNNVTAEADELMIVAKDAKDEKAAKDIVSDAKHLKEVAQKDPAQVKHTGEGEGGGGLGKCPVVLKDTHITITEIPGGAKIALKPMKPEQLEW